MGRDAPHRRHPQQGRSGPRRRGRADRPARRRRRAARGRRARRPAHGRAGEGEGEPARREGRRPPRPGRADAHPGRPRQRTHPAGAGRDPHVGARQRLPGRRRGHDPQGRARGVRRRPPGPGREGQLTWATPTRSSWTASWTKSPCPATWTSRPPVSVSPSLRRTSGRTR
ncbi:hypothetical protein SGPA1_70093 [Streptomyces misionensis JCM 4497]